MKITTFLTMTAVSALLLVAGDLATPAEAASKVRVKTVNVAPKPKIRLRPRVAQPKIRVNTKRLTTKNTNDRTKLPANTVNQGGPQPEPPTTPKHESLTNINPTVLPRDKPSRFAALDNGRLDRLRELDDVAQIFNTLRELEIIRNIDLFGQEDGSTPGDYDEFTTGLADSLPDGVNPTEPTVTTEAAPEHVDLLTSGIPQPGAGIVTTPPDDGGTERHPGGNRPGQGRRPTGNAKLDLSGRNGPASDGFLHTENYTADLPGTTYTGGSQTNGPSGSSSVNGYRTADGFTVVYYRFDHNERTSEDRKEAIRLTREGDKAVVERFIWDDVGQEYLRASRNEYPLDDEADQPLPVDGADNSFDISGLCGSIIPSYMCRQVKSATPEDMTQQPDDENGSGNRMSITRLGQDVVTDTGDGSFQTPRAATPHSEAVEDDGFVRPGPLPNCPNCTPDS